jgi:iron complex transport system substrate-binding protein
MTAGAALVAACSSPKPGEVAKDGSVTVKHIFGETKIPAPPKRVVSAGSPSRTTCWRSASSRSR